MECQLLQWKLKLHTRVVWLCHRFYWSSLRRLRFLANYIPADWNKQHDDNLDSLPLYSYTFSALLLPRLITYHLHSDTTAAQPSLVSFIINDIQRHQASSPAWTGPCWFRKTFPPNLWDWEAISSNLKKRQYFFSMSTYVQFRTKIQIGYKSFRKQCIITDSHGDVHRMNIYFVRDPVYQRMIEC